MSPGDLLQVLQQLPSYDDPNVVLGLNPADDAAVYRLDENTYIVQTVDFFTPIVDDPYDFGKIAAANALSDIYAMGGKPIFALNIVAFPARESLDILAKILKGGADKAREAGIVIAGGHTIDDPEPKYGLCVTGLIKSELIFTKKGAKPGDLLILTKPLGIGIITTAIKGEAASSDIIKEAVSIMEKLNKDASEAMIKAGASACTDITGFGFIGHLHEMIASGNIGAEIDFSKLPFIEGALKLAEEGLIPGGAYKNRKFYAPYVEWEKNINETEQLMLYDPQTSGGLLISINEERKDLLISHLRNNRVDTINVVGRIVESESEKIKIWR